MKKRICAAMFVSMGLLLSQGVRGEYQETQPRGVRSGEIAVRKAGNFTRAGATYVLMADISSPMTPVFLGNNVTLDLNGHTITFADGGYEPIKNYGFEDGLEGWDVSKAPGAKVISSDVQPLVGKQVLQLKRGDEIISSWVNLPVADRSYFAMCAVAKREMRISINVENEKGEAIECVFTGGDSPRRTIPVTNEHPELGGGVIYGHMHHMPKGKYRLRIKAETDCIIDECDLRPALDAGIGIAGGISPWSSYQDHLNWYPSAFFDYNQKNTGGKPIAGLPIIQGGGMITIKNGVIKNGALGIRTVGVLSNAKNVRVLLENVKIMNAGINANSTDIAKGTLKDCRFEVDTPFIVNRHNTSESNVQVHEADEISGCAFIGGQGNYSGACPNIHDNLFVNAQTVTNHYSISPGSGTKVYNNVFEPRLGSGIYIGKGTGVEVYDNVFKITSNQPNNEYRYSEYSVNAVRLSDYNKPESAPAAERCAGNKVYHNKIYITGKSYPQYKGYEPRTYAFFISVGGGINEVYDNEIVVNKVDDGNVGAYAFFIGGSNNGGKIYGNTITSNCPAVWMGTDYGDVKHTWFYDNAFIKAEGTPEDVTPIVLGDGGHTVSEVGFYSNTFDGWKNIFTYRNLAASYDWGWTVTAKVVNGQGQSASGEEVTAMDASGKEAEKAITDAKGEAKLHLAAWTYADQQKKMASPYTITAGGAKTTVAVDVDKQVELKE